MPAELPPKLETLTPRFTAICNLIVDDNGIRFKNVIEQTKILSFSSGLILMFKIHLEEAAQYTDEPGMYELEGEIISGQITMEKEMRAYATFYFDQNVIGNDTFVEKLSKHILKFSNFLGGNEKVLGINLSEILPILEKLTNDFDGKLPDFPVMVVINRIPDENKVVFKLWRYLELVY